MAYRGSRPQPHVKPSGGLIEEVVQQFADRYAFTRELVQNAIDAGASQIRVELEIDADRLRVRFSDDGCGMTLDVIQGPLLTLFSSSKEGVAGKIGRYGVGFKSVLAVDPELVLVETRTATGAYAVRLYRDYRFEIEERPQAPGSGTSVELVLPAGEVAEPSHATRVREALSRWCRHVGCPIHLRIPGEPWVRVNEPLTLSAPVVVELEVDGVRVAVGPSAGSEALPTAPGPEGVGDFAGFYGRGLTLLEAHGRPPCLIGLRFKVDSPALTCTLSRDDVRRDDAFERAIALVERAAGEPLARALREAQARAAQAFGERGDADSFSAYHALCLAWSARYGSQELEVALAEPFEGRRTLPLSEVRALSKASRAVTVCEPTALSRRASEAGYACVRIDPGGELVRHLTVGAPPLTTACTLLGAAGVHPSHPALLALRGVLQRVGREVESVVPVEELEGSWLRLAAFVDGGGGATRGSWADPFDLRWTGSRLLLGPTLWRALEQARPVGRAAGLVARLVLLDADGTPSAKLNERLLAACAELAP